VTSVHSAVVAFALAGCGMLRGRSLGVLVLRLDLYLVEQGFFRSRTEAQAAIKAGMVRVDGLAALKPANHVGGAQTISIEGSIRRYVSRAGEKLATALDHFRISPEGLTVLDLGASTGGFTDLVLQGGARRVYAVDVGHGQLDRALARDERVVNLEKTHARELTASHVPEPVDLLVCDVSFISCRKVLPHAFAFLATGASLIVLVKPQFELGPDYIGKGGLVRAQPGDITALLDDMRQWFEALEFVVKGIIASPILGGDGNQEYLLCAQKSETQIPGGAD